MKTAIDSSVLLDVLGAGQKYAEQSRAALKRAYDSGALVCCEVVWAEVRANYRADEPFIEAMKTMGVTFEPLSSTAALTAGKLWRESRSRSPRNRVVADLLVGAHALHQADALLTRDRGFYRSFFEGLRVLDVPSKW